MQYPANSSPSLPVLRASSDKIFRGDRGTPPTGMSPDYELKQNASLATSIAFLSFAKKSGAGLEFAGHEV